MKTKPMLFFIFLIVIGLIGLSGCSANTDVNERQFKLEDAAAAIQAQKVEIVSYGITGYPLKLNGMVPEVYSIEEPQSAENVEPEWVYFYVYTSENARTKGVKDFNKQMKSAKYTTYPFLYEKGNVLVIYWSNSKEQNVIGDAIETGLQQLS
jgi:hypothetical protein